MIKSVPSHIVVTKFRCRYILWRCGHWPKGFTWPKLELFCKNKNTKNFRSSPVFIFFLPSLLSLFLLSYKWGWYLMVGSNEWNILTAVPFVKYHILVQAFRLQHFNFLFPGIYSSVCVELYQRIINIPSSSMKNETVGVVYLERVIAALEAEVAG